ncbi:MAG: GNAT family N-acetyltransferase [Pseudomonadota bacterium]
MSDIFQDAIIRTSRLRLEPYQARHAKALNAINNEPDVMRFLSDGEAETLQETRNLIKRVTRRWEQLGYSWWAIIDVDTDQIIGAACLQHVAGQPGAELEIGWRLTAGATGKGYATEAGLAAANYAFDVVGADHVIATAHPDNLPSHRVMERIGMMFRGIERHYDMPSTTYVLTKADREAARSTSFRGA